jgi:hypothetical protein
VFLDAVTVQRPFEWRTNEHRALDGRGQRNQIAGNARLRGVLLGLLLEISPPR